MDITFISTQTTEEPDQSLMTTKLFGILLSKSLSIIHMVHWYTTNFNVHEIMGDLYEDLNNLFDKLQEEIIGTSKTQKILFPGFGVESFDLDNWEQFSDHNTELLDLYLKTSTKLIAILSSREMDNYISSVTSGLNNTREDILSRINKTNYLLGMI